MRIIINTLFSAEYVCLSLAVSVRTQYHHPIEGGSAKWCLATLEVEMRRGLAGATAESHQYLPERPRTAASSGLACVLCTLSSGTFRTPDVPRAARASLVPTTTHHLVWCTAQSGQ